MSNALMIQLGMEGAREEMRGHLLFRDALVDKSKLPAGHKAMLVAGLVLVPEHFLIEAESMVQIKGFNTGRELCVFTNPDTKKLDSRYSGWKLDDILSEPIWKF